MKLGWRMFVSLGLSLCISEAFAESSLPQGAASPASGKCAPRAPMAPPRYPDEASKRLSGTTVLVLSLDTCGVVTHVQVESSSGHAQLDDAASAAARDWMFLEGDEPRRVRVPVDFSPDGLPPLPLLEADGTPRARPKAADSIEQMLAHYDRMQFSPVQKPASDGTLPAWIDDTLPPDFPTIGEHLAALAREGEALPEQDHVRAFSISQNLRMETYEVYDDAGWPWAPALVRRRVVSDGTHSFWASMMVCEGNAEACRQFGTLLRKNDKRQDVMAPPPAPPPIVRRAR